MHPNHGHARPRPAPNPPPHHCRRQRHRRQFATAIRVLPSLLLLVLCCCTCATLASPTNDRHHDIGGAAAHQQSIAHRTSTPAFLPPGGTCQSICACKWKGGKQTAECLTAKLIQIPLGIDSSTQVLDMSGNNLQRLPARSFLRANLPNLQKIFMRDCRIGEIDDDALQGITNLNGLDLSYNLITSIPRSAVLRHVSALRELILTGNPIQRVDADAFAAVRSLTRIDLSNCRLTALAPGLFNHLSNLRELRLNSNQLFELPTGTLDALPADMHTLELQLNPWVCDCRMRAFKKWLLGSTVSMMLPPECTGGPERVAERSIGVLRLEEFACAPLVQPDDGDVGAGGVRRVVHVSQTENATFECTAMAAPVPTVEWYWNGKPLANGTEFGQSRLVPAQMVWIADESDGETRRRSRLQLTNMQLTDVGTVFCLAHNSAGSAQTGFVLEVGELPSVLAMLGTPKIAGLTALVAMLLFLGILAIVWVLIKNNCCWQPETETKQPAGVAGGAGAGAGACGAGGVGVAVGSAPNAASVRSTSPTSQGLADSAATGATSTSVHSTVYMNGGGATGKMVSNSSSAKTGGVDIERSAATVDSEHSEYHRLYETRYSAANSTNPLQKPPRADTEQFCSSYVYISPTGSTHTANGNNPDLINSTTQQQQQQQQQQSYQHRAAAAIDELQQLQRVDQLLTSATDLDLAAGPTATALSGSAERPGSGAYSRAGGCDSLYPSGLWPTAAVPASAGAETNANDLHFLGTSHRRTGGSTLELNSSSSSSSPFTGAGGRTPLMHAMMQAERGGLNNNSGSGNCIADDNCVGASASTASPADFMCRTFPRSGLSSLHSAAHQQHQPSTTTTTTTLGSSGSNAGGYPSDYGLPLAHGSESHHLRSSRDLLLQQLQQQQQSAASAGRVGQGMMGVAAPASTSAKTLRVWQRGGVPVLPPVTALKRALTSSRNSPDEGYQEGCGTDV